MTRSIAGFGRLGPTTNSDPSIAVGEGGVWVSTWPVGSRPQLVVLEEETGAVRDRIHLHTPSRSGSPPADSTCPFQSPLAAIALAEGDRFAVVGVLDI